MTDSLTPMMTQYLRAKQAHPGALLFFRMGDFFEMFYEDAKVAAQTLGIALTSRSKGEGAVPMAGVPVRSYTRYLQQLIRAGHRVAICEQIGDPETSEGLVDREVIRVVTAGTLTEEELLDGRRNNFLLALAPAKKQIGLAWGDVSTSNFFVDTVDRDKLLDEIPRIAPAEILVPESLRNAEPSFFREIEAAAGCPVSGRPDWSYVLENAARALREQFGVRTLEGFGIEEGDPSVPAAGALLDYLRETQKGSLPQLGGIERFRRGEHCLLDRATRATLELTETLRGESREGTLLGVLDRTLTPMGARELRQWILSPLREPAAIRLRQGAVREIFERKGLRESLRGGLRDVLDIERILAKLSFNRGNARDLVALKNSLDAVPGLKTALHGCSSPHLAEIATDLDPLDELREAVGRAFVEDPPFTLRDGGLVRPGYSAELDELRGIGKEGLDWMARFQSEEIQRTGIANLKVGFNRVFGYYIEITNANRDAAPANYIRKQTLKNAERFITPELKEFEAKVLKSEDLAKELEYKIFLDLRGRAASSGASILRNAKALARLDAIASLAEAAIANRYVAPEVGDGIEIRIVEGRHPVLERTLSREPIVPNDTLLDEKLCRTVLLTGPNMSGKSTYIRQVALIVLMAQIGSFVPAESASVGVVDRIFTRIGAADEIARGNSTFMVEMVEMANILRNASERSLIVLDEVGRGTSTFDGLAIAWAVAEHIHQRIRARTLFATHYHQMTELATRFEGLKNFNVAVRERGEEIVFLHKIVEGGTDRSYGIHVARLAGVPRPVLDRAREILADLEEDAEHLAPKILASGTGREAGPREQQLNLFGGHNT